MHTHLMKTLTTTALIAGFIAAPLSAEPASGAEILKLLNGNTLKGSTAEVGFSEYYDPDGTIRGEGYTGQWKVEGDTGCMAYDDTGFKCWTAEIIGDANIWTTVGDAAPTAAGMMVPGNPQNY